MTNKTSSTIESATYPVLPLRDIVVFPHMIVPLFVGREKSIRALEEVMGTDKQILLATQMNAGDDDPEPSAIYRDRHGRQRAAIAEAARRHREGAGRRPLPRRDRWLYRAAKNSTKPWRMLLAEPEEDPVEIEALSRSVVSEFENYVKLNKKISPEVVGAASQIEDYSKLADTVASHLAIKIAEKQEMLETDERQGAP